MSGEFKKMKNLLLLYIFMVIIIGLTGCNTYGGYQPTIDPRYDRNAQYIQQDMLECKQLAGQAGSFGTETAKGAGVGALLGGAGGAVAGAFLGNPGIGAAVGASAGAFGGAATQGYEADHTYKRAFNTCMRNRGHVVIN